VARSTPLLFRIGRSNQRAGGGDGTRRDRCRRDVLFVEASVSEGPEGLTLTGQLGDVMKESAEIAMSYVRSHAEELNIDPKVFSGKRFHFHVPAGAIPKDGLRRASP